jgi:hypothetical protein
VFLDRVLAEKPEEKVNERSRPASGAFGNETQELEVTMSQDHRDRGLPEERN